jgi:hypothetical protein
LKLIEGQDSDSELIQVASMRDSLGLPPITPTTLIKLETDNRELIAKLRKTRIMLNDNTTRAGSIFDVNWAENVIETFEPRIPMNFKQRSLNIFIESYKNIS